MKRVTGTDVEGNSFHAGTRFLLRKANVKGLQSVLSNRYS